MGCAAMIERSFAHCYETGGMRRCYLRGHQNILKRQLIHVGAFNLSLILRKSLGAGTPRQLKNRAQQWLHRLFAACKSFLLRPRSLTSDSGAALAQPSLIRTRCWPLRKQTTFTTGC